MSLKEVDNSLYIAIVTTSGEVVIYHMNVERGPKGQTYTNATKQHSALSIINRENCIQEKNINCGISWAPGPSLTLAVPAFSGSLCLLRKHDPSSTTWIEEMVVSADVTLGHGSLDLTMVCYSPNGKYLLSSDMKGFVACWRCDERASNYEILRKWHTTPLNNKHLDDIRWGLEVESNYMLLLAGSHYARVKDVVNMKVGHASPTAMTANEPVAAAGISDANESLSNGVAPASGKSLKRSKKPPLGVDNDDEDIEFDTTNVRGPVLEENLRKKSILDDEALDALADDKENGLVIDDDMESEDDEAQGPYLPNGGMNIEYQPPIQLACTTYDEQGRRYLTWNHIGSIVSRQDTIISGGTSSNRIEIRFSDAMSANRQEVITDHYGYSMAALSQDGAIFAAAPDDAADDDEDDHANGMTSALNKFLANKNLPGSVVYYHAFPNSMKLTGNPGATYNDTFQFTLSHKEAVTAVACGSGWVAFSTNKNYLRVLTTTGIQLSIIRLKGDVVSMVGEGSKLAIAYHRGVPMHDTPNLAVDIYSISNYDSAAATSTTAANGASVGISSMIYQQDVVLPLTKGSTLSWMGFDVTEGSENNNPSNHMNMLVVMDSSDVISTLVHTSRITTHPTNGTAIPNTNARVNDFAWVPVLDVNQVKKSFDHHYWPIAVKGFRLLYVLLHGESKPAIHPQPIVTTQAYKLPIIELRSDSTSKKDKEKEAINESVRSVMLDHMKYVNMEYCKYDIEDSILLSTNTSGAASENALSLLDAAEAKCTYHEICCGCD